MGDLRGVQLLMYLLSATTSHKMTIQGEMQREGGEGERKGSLLVMFPSSKTPSVKVLQKVSKLS
jgi:hypothetical protein